MEAGVSAELGDIAGPGYTGQPPTVGPLDDQVPTPSDQ
jgi:hypothetical protein